jgi:hypothetical protein
VWGGRGWCGVRMVFTQPALPSLGFILSRMGSISVRPWHEVRSYVRTLWGRTDERNCCSWVPPVFPDVLFCAWHCAGH